MNNLWRRPTSRVHPSLLALFVIVLATVVYFAPVLGRIGTYIPGGDAMFNAWVLERNQHCILREHCPDYIDANIYFPNHGTMLYSEVELSPSVVTLPLHAITDNPIPVYNVITIASFLAIGISMYYFALYLSKGRVGVSLLAALAYEFGPITFASTTHLQNLAIFAFPLSFLAILKYIETNRRSYLLGLFIVLLYVFYASWYQVVFLTGAVIVLLSGLWVGRRLRGGQLINILVVVTLALLTTAPLAIQYVRFAHDSGATYTLEEKVANSSSISDYAIAPAYTLLGKLLRQISAIANIKQNTLSYVSLTLLMVAGFGLYIILKRRKVFRQVGALYLSLCAIGVVGLLVSLGPLLRFAGTAVHHVFGVPIVLPLPYFLIHLFVPQLGFLRGLARASAIVLFIECSLLALVAPQLTAINFYKSHKKILTTIVVILVISELAPVGLMPVSTNAYSYHADIPEIYQYIKHHPNIDNIIILQAEDYPNVDFWFARTEDVLWSGYHNRNIFNGYSGYIPPRYESDYANFVNLTPLGPAEMRNMGLKYVMVDRLLYTNKPEVLARIPSILGRPIYRDNRYDMYKL